MANEIYHNYDEGNTLYAVIHRKTDDQVYDGAGGFEAWVDGNMDNYDIPMTDHDGNYYSADFPSAITASGIYRVTVFLQVGASPHFDNDIGIAQGEIEWGGTSEITLLSLSSEGSKQVNVFGAGE